MKHKSIRQKGKEGEKEWAHIISKTFDTRYARTPDSGAWLKADALRAWGARRTIADDFIFEIKRVEKLNIHEAWEQVNKAASPSKIPVVAHRRNHEPWKITMNADHWLRLMKELDGYRRESCEK